MDQPLHNYMRLGIVFGAAFPAAATDAEALTRGIETIASDPFFATVDVCYVPDDGSRKHMVDVLRASHLGVVYEASPRFKGMRLDLNSLDDGARRQAIVVARQVIDEAIEVGAERVNLISGPDPEPGRRGDATDVLFEALCDLASYTADRGGPVLALEPFPRGGTDSRLVGPTAEGVALVRLVREVYPDVGLTLDTGYVALRGEDASVTLAMAAPYLGQLHLANVMPGGGADALPFGIEGGVYDVPQVANLLLTLFQTGFLSLGRRPLVTIRVAPRGGERAEWVIAGAKRTLLEAWTRL